MSGTIEEAFVKQFEAEVAEAYQRQGSKLRPTVRSKTDVKGASTIFPRVGKGTAAAKARNGAVPVMNLTYSNASCRIITLANGLTSWMRSRRMLMNAASSPMRVPMRWAARRMS
jgi:hypothetical protein